MVGLPEPVNKTHDEDTKRLCHRRHGRERSKHGDMASHGRTVFGMTVLVDSRS